MKPIEEMSPETGRRLGEILEPEEIVRLCVASDMLHHKAYGQKWLVVTDRRLLVFSLEEGDDYTELPLNTISSARIQHLVGGGRLEVSVDGEFSEILYFTSSLSAKFGEVSKAIEQLAKGQELAVSLDAEKIRCSKCGRLLPERNGICPACLHKGAVFKRIVSYMRPYRLRVAILTGLAFIIILAELVPPYLSKVLVDRVLIPRQNLKLLFIVVGVMAGMAALRWLTSFAHGWVVTWLSGGVTRDIRAQLYRCLERLTLKFYDKREVGAIMSRVTHDSGRLQDFLVDGLPYILNNSILLLGIGTVLFIMSWQLTLFVLIPVPLLFFGGALFWTRMRGVFYKWWQRWAQFSAQLNESISGIKVVKAFAQEDREISRFDNRNQDLFNIGVRADRIWFAFFTTMIFFTNLGGIIVWLVGGKSVVAGRLTLGTLIAFNGYLWMFYHPLQWLSQLNNWMTRAFAGAERIFEVIDSQPEAYDVPDAVAMPFINGGVEFRNVTFGYERYRPVLHDINFNVEPGEMIGLVGKSGVGKTSIINLICRFYAADEGTIAIDGVDINKIKLNDLRRQIGMVLQEPFLFNGTISENIAYGKPGASLEEVMEAARAANAHNFILAKPDGYDTQVGERGNKLSVGEKQRISIARAVLHDPRILILDEATSSVDTETEKQIQQALARLVHQRTTFAIAHRLSTLRNATRLVILEGGRIAEIGTHDELLAKEGVYYRLVQTQTELSKIKALEE